MSETVTPDNAAIHLDHVSKVFGKPGTDAAYRGFEGLNLDLRPGQMLSARPAAASRPSST